jgi:hypothetical protein
MRAVTNTEEKPDSTFDSIETEKALDLSREGITGSA